MDHYAPGEHDTHEFVGWYGSYNDHERLPLRKMQIAYVSFPRPTAGRARSCRCSRKTLPT